MKLTERGELKGEFRRLLDFVERFFERFWAEVEEFRALRAAQRPAEAPEAPCDGEAPVADIDWAAVSCEGLEVEVASVEEMLRKRWKK